MSDVEVALAAAEAGAAVVRSSYGRELERFAKSGTDFATNVDLESERAILAVIAEARPDDAREGEESAAVDGASGRRWLVDPLCGTLNYAAATPLAAVNVALQVGDDVPIGASADPIADELFWTDGQLSLLRRAGRDEPLTPSAISGLVDVNCDGPLDRPFIGGGLVADPAFRTAFGPRVISSTLAVAWVAAGRRAGYVSDGFFRGSVHFAAGIAVCVAAGCVVSDLAGQPLHTGRGLIVAADEATHARLVDLIRPHLDALE
jgi:fructose-1,6-bisphosphatase/inositol monophosphatase family enzyme